MAIEAKPNNAVCLTYSRALAASPFSASPAIFTISFFLLSLKRGSNCRHCTQARNAKDLIRSIHPLHKHVHSTNMYMRMYIHTCSCSWGQWWSQRGGLARPMLDTPGVSGSWGPWPWNCCRGASERSATVDTSVRGGGIYGLIASTTAP